MNSFQVLMESRIISENQSGLGQRHDDAPVHAPPGASIDECGLDQLVGDTAEEAAQHEDADRQAEAEK